MILSGASIVFMEGALHYVMLSRLSYPSSSFSATLRGDTCLLSRPCYPTLSISASMIGDNILLKGIVFKDIFYPIIYYLGDCHFLFIIYVLVYLFMNWNILAVNT